MIHPAGRNVGDGYLLTEKPPWIGVLLSGVVRSMRLSARSGVGLPLTAAVLIERVGRPFMRSVSMETGQRVTLVNLSIASARGMGAIAMRTRSF